MCVIVSDSGIIVLSYQCVGSTEEQNVLDIEK